MMLLFPPPWPGSVAEIEVQPYSSECPRAPTTQDWVHAPQNPKWSARSVKAQEQHPPEQPPSCWETACEHFSHSVISFLPFLMLLKWGEKREEHQNFMKRGPNFVWQHSVFKIVTVSSFPRVVHTVMSPASLTSESNNFSEVELGQKWV